MTNSFSKLKVEICSKCNAQVSVNEWQIIDAEEHPELLEKIGDESINDYHCPTCGTKNNTNSIILVFRPNKEFPIIFRIPSDGGGETDEEITFLLMKQFQKQLESRWDDKWFQNVIFISQVFLASFISTSISTTCTLDESIEILLPILGELSFPESVNDIDRRISLCAYGLKHVTREKHPLLWASLNNEVGVTFVNRKDGDVIENFEIAINYFIKTQEVWTKEKYPQQWAMASSNIGSSLYHLLAQNIIQDYEAPIKYWLQALEAFNENTYPLKYITTHRMIADAYIHTPFTLEIGTIAQAQLKAIYHYKCAQKLLSRTSYPEIYDKNTSDLILVYENCIMVHRNCILTVELLRDGVPENIIPEFYFTTAELYFDLAKLKNSKDNIEQAILCFHKALEYFTVDNYPDKWGEANYYLAKIYQDFYRDDAIERYKKVIDHSQKALIYFESHGISANCSELYHDIGLAYLEWSNGVVEQQLEDSIHYLNLADNLCNIEQNPQLWAMIQHNLGVAYTQRLLDERSNNIDKAIHYFEQALSISKNTLDEHSANTKVNLGRAYIDRENGKKIENLERAAEYLEQALHTYTEQEYPDKWTQIHENLGNIYTELANEQS